MTSFAVNWLNIQCQAISNLNAATLLLVDNENSLQMAAHWPEQDFLSPRLITVAKEAFAKRQVIINTAENDESGSLERMDYVAKPIFFNHKVFAVIAVRTTPKTNQERNKLLEALKLGSQWLALPENHQQGDEAFYATIVKLTAGCFEQKKYRHCLTTLIAALCDHFDCERVTLGEHNNHQTNVVALSNAGQFDDKTRLIRMIADAMDEAIDQDKIIVFPNVDENETVIEFAHRELHRTFGAACICTLPLVCDGKIFGALTLEFRKPGIDSKAVRLLEMTLALVTPFLKIKKSDERWLGQKVWDSAVQFPETIFNFERLGLKLAIFFLLLFLIFAAMTDGDFRVSADAVLEGKIQRTIAAPMDGFIESADVRAGDVVEKNQLMAMLEDADLQLEKISLSSQQKKLKREYREALADHDLVKIRVIDAQLDQIKAKSLLVSEMQRRTKIKAPFAGIVIVGDLSQSLGSPVNRGDGLFKIAPLEGYRMILKVNEKDISHVYRGQHGVLMLSSFPGEKLDLTVEKITAIASPEEGGNIFRVEASVTQVPEKLRPGMEGMAKIDAGKQKLLWIWTRDFVAWLKLWLWSWVP